MRIDMALRRLAVTGLGVLFITALAEPAMAQTSSSTGNIATFIQNIIDILNNSVVRGLAVIAIIITGLAWMFGHLDMRRAGTVVVGIIVVFGAATIVTLITGTSGS